MLKFVSRGDAGSSASTSTDSVDPHPAPASTNTEPVLAASASTNTDQVQLDSANTNTDPMQLSSSSTNTESGEVQAASASTSTTRGVQPASDTSSSDPNRTVAAPPNDPGDWSPVLTDFMRTELVGRGPFKLGLDFSYPKNKSRRGFHSGLLQTAVKWGKDYQELAFILDQKQHCVSVSL